MRKEALKAAARAARARGRRRIVMGGASVVAGLAVAAIVGAGQSGAQYNPYPPSMTPTTTSTTPAPSPVRTQATGTVLIKGTTSATYRFSPRTLRVKRGKRVKWTWNSNAPHNVKVSKLHKKSRTAERLTYRLRFAKAGTYRYVCTVHGFTGKVVVR